MKWIDYTGPEELREPTTELFENVRDFYLGEGADPDRFDVKVEIENSDDKGAYDRGKRKIYLWINPIKIPFEICYSTDSNPFKEEEKLHQISSPVIRKYTKEDKIENITKLLKECAVNDGENIKKLEEYAKIAAPKYNFSEKQLLLFELLGKCKEAIYKQKLHEKQEIREFLVKIARNYMEDEDILKVLYGTGVHETAHKELWETKPEGTVRIRNKYFQGLSYDNGNS